MTVLVTVMMIVNKNLNNLMVMRVESTTTKSVDFGSKSVVVTQCTHFE